MAKEVENSQHQVFSRKYRPQTFADVLGQDPIVATLKNAVRGKRLAHAYLFCGSRGTGKTTLARIFAKTVNCSHLTEKLEPCNECPSCKQITGGASLDVLEIDGASNRGIDDIRKINETVGYTTSAGGYKTYIIDEVHMLTKEAFNALLKTLEEPPARVLFLFATTEPHKILPTILSRCQRFNLSRIPIELVAKKLRRICDENSVKVDEEVLRLIASRSEGALRDAESLLDQLVAYQQGSILTLERAQSIMGLASSELFFSLDTAGAEGRLSFAFEVAEKLYSEGKDLVHFVEMLTEHVRKLLIVKLCGGKTPLLDLTSEEQTQYEAHAKFYTKEQCLTLLDYLSQELQQFRFSLSPRIALESLLLKVLRTHRQIPVEHLLKKLAELESRISNNSKSQPPADAIPASAPAAKEKVVLPAQKVVLPAQKSDPETIKKTPISLEAPTEQPAAAMTPFNAQTQTRYDTMLQFAAVELEGTIQRKK